MMHNRNILNLELQKTGIGASKLQNTKFYALLAALTVLIGNLCLSPVISSLMNSVVIGSTGQILTATVTAASGHWRDIQNAVDAAAVYGIADVYIPEGEWKFVEVGEAWTGTAVNIPVGVNVFGASTERDANGQVIEWKTVLTMPWDVPGGDANPVRWFRIVGNSNPIKSSRFSDIKLVGYRTINPDSTSMHLGLRIENVLNFRVDHCFFLNTAAGAVMATGSSLQNGLDTVCGVIDHCKIVNTKGSPAPYDTRTIDYGVYVSRGSGWSYNYEPWETNAAEVLGKYTDYTVFIEDCYLEKWRHCVAVGHGGHAVVRYSTIANDYAYGSIDIHGNPPGRAIEIYNCTIIDAIPGGQVYATFIRGGAGVAFNNVVGGGTYSTFIYLSNENSDSEYWVNDWYIWDSTMLSGCHEITEYDPNNQITEGISYFRYAPGWYTSYPYPHPLTLDETP